jgi:hypothetical protein
MIPIFSIASCIREYGGFVVTAKSLSTGYSNEVKTFNHNFHEFKYLNVCNDTSGGFIFNSRAENYLESVNGVPDPLLRFGSRHPHKSCGVFVVYGIDSDSNHQIVFENNYEEETNLSSFMLTGYVNFRIEYVVGPEISYPIDASIGELIFGKNESLI